jgi:hypothetical protein
MELVAVIRMTLRHRLVELDAEPRPTRRDHVPVLPANRRLQDLRVEAAPVIGIDVARSTRAISSGRSGGVGSSSQSGS